MSADVLAVILSVTALVVSVYANVCVTIAMRRIQRLRDGK